MGSVSPVKLDSFATISIELRSTQSAGIALPDSIITRSPTTRSSDEIVVVIPLRITIAEVLSDLA